MMSLVRFIALPRPAHGFFFAVCAFALSVLAPSPAFPEKLNVVASIVPLADFARQVGGDRISVTLLLPPGASEHTYEATPRLMQAISKARVFIKVGAGLELWADRLVGPSRRGLAVVTASEGLPLIRLDEREGDRAAWDPHVWLDPLLSIEIVKKIEGALSAADRPNAALYRRNADIYIGRLRELDREIAGRTGTFRIKEYVTFHSAWNYFSRRYGLKVAGVIEESPGKEPSPRHLGRILAELKRINSRVVFAEPQFSSKVAEAIAREAKARVLFLDPVGGSAGRETYIALMRHNVSVMEGAMR